MQEITAQVIEQWADSAPRGPLGADSTATVLDAQSAYEWLDAALVIDDAGTRFETSMAQTNVAEPMVTQRSRTGQVVQTWLIHQHPVNPTDWRCSGCAIAHDGADVVVFGFAHGPGQRSPGDDREIA